MNIELGCIRTHINSYNMTQDTDIIRNLHTQTII